jgi:hypothetical protein
LADGLSDRIAFPVGLTDRLILVAVDQNIENSINIKEIPKLETFIDSAEFCGGKESRKRTCRAFRKAREVPLTGEFLPVGMGDMWAEKTGGMGDRCR